MENEAVVDAIIDRMLPERFHLGFASRARAVVNMIKALGILRAPSAARPIIMVLDETWGHEDELNKSVRENGLEALGDIGGEEAIASIIRHFDYHEREADTKNCALKAIKHIGSPAVEALTAALKSDNSTMKSCALNALDGIGDKKAINHIIPLLKDDDEQVAGYAALAISHLVSTD